MFSLDRKLASSTCVAERSVGKTKPPNSVLPCPTHSRNSFHPFLCPPPLSPSPDHIAQSHFSDPPLPPTLPLHQSPSPPSHIIRPHKPHPGRSILYNELRPHVPASDHIFSWHTPFGSRHHAAVAQRLPPPSSNLHSWPSGGLLLLTPNQPMVPALYVSHNFATNGPFLKKIACLLTMPYSAPS